MGMRISSSTLSIDKALSDAEQFFNTLEEVHPHLLTKLSANFYIALKRTTKRRIEKKADLKGQVLRSEFASILAQASACFNDGHTGIFPDLSYIEKTDFSCKVLPFRLNREKDDLVLGAATPELEELKGRKLISINGEPTLRALAPILERISGESQALRLSRFVAQQSLYLAWISPFKSEILTVTLEGCGDVFSRQIELIPLQDYNTFVTGTNEYNSPGFHAFYHDGLTCYYRYNCFIESCKERQYVDELFREIFSKGTQDLIMDLRFNSGGNSKMGDYILQFLTSKPYQMASRIDLKLSEPVFALGVHTALRDLTGLIITYRGEPNASEKPQHSFTGNFYVLTSPYTFSSAAQFASVIKDYKIGLLIGGETGGLRQSFGERIDFRLLHSCISFGSSTKVFYAATPYVNDELHGTMPDIAPDEEDLLLYHDTSDPLIHFTLDYISLKRTRDRKKEINSVPN